MELVTFPVPNPALTAWLIGPRCDEILHEIGDGKAVPLYQSIVAKRTGRLGASARFHIEIGGIHHDRHIGILTVGEGLAYGAAHEFGVGDHLMSVHNLDGPNAIQAAAHDLNRVLEEIGHS